MIQRRAASAVAAIVVAAALAGCGFDAPAVTEHEKNSVQAQELKIGPVTVGDIFVTTTTDTTVSPATYLVATLINTSTTADRLSSVSSPQGWSVTLSGAGLGGAVAVPPRGVPVRIGTEPTGITARLRGAAPPQIGTYLPLQFTFANAGTTPVAQVPVIPDTKTTAPTSPVPTTQAPLPTESGEPVIE